MGATGPSGETGGLIWLDMAVQPAHNLSFSEMGAAELRGALSKIEPLPHNVMTASRNNLPATYIFKTRSGDCGILQITDILSNPPRVAFTYKLAVPTPNQQPAEANYVGPEQKTDVAVVVEDSKIVEKKVAPLSAIAHAGKKVVGIGPGWQKLQRVIGDNYGGSIGGYSDDEQKCGEYFEKVLSWAKPGDTFVIMFALDEEKFQHSQTVPKAYQDLLPKPWLEIKEQFDRGEVLELKGKARGLDTIVLAAPTLDRLDELIQSTELLKPFKNS